MILEGDSELGPPQLWEVNDWNESAFDDLTNFLQRRYFMSDITQKVPEIDSTNLPPLVVIETQSIATNVITCLMKSDIVEFMKNEKRTQDYGITKENAPQYEPYRNELCLARNKEGDTYAWYRCIYKENLMGCGALMYCIDHGKRIAVQANDFRVSHFFEHIFLKFCIHSAI